MFAVNISVIKYKPNQARYSDGHGKYTDTSPNHIVNVTMALVFIGDNKVQWFRLIIKSRDHHSMSDNAEMMRCQYFRENCMW